MTIAHGGAAARAAGGAGAATAATRVLTGAPSRLLPHRVPAELRAQRRQHAVAERVLLARAEAPEEREREHRRRHAAIDRLEHGPAPLARVLDVAADLVEAGIAGEGALGELQKPRAHHAALVPEMGDGLEIVIVVGRAQELEALGVGLHHSVLDAVV